MEPEDRIAGRVPFRAEESVSFFATTKIVWRGRVLRLCFMPENVIPWLPGRVPVSWRQAMIGRPDRPSRVTTFVYDLLYRLPASGAQILDCKRAREAISRRRPKIFIEMDHSEGNRAANAVPELLVSWGYQMQCLERRDLTGYVRALPGGSSSSGPPPRQWGTQS